LDERHVVTIVFFKVIILANPITREIYYMLSAKSTIKVLVAEALYYSVECLYTPISTICTN